MLAGAPFQTLRDAVPVWHGCAGVLGQGRFAQGCRGRQSRLCCEHVLDIRAASDLGLGHIAGQDLGRCLGSPRALALIEHADDCFGQLGIAGREHVALRHPVAQRRDHALAVARIDARAGDHAHRVHQLIGDIEIRPDIARIDGGAERRPIRRQILEHAQQVLDRRVFAFGQQLQQIISVEGTREKGLAQPAQPVDV